MYIQFILIYNLYALKYFLVFKINYKCLNKTKISYIVLELKRDF